MGSRVCVIGAGSSGIAAAKALKQRGLDFDCFERRDRVGGLWAVEPGEVQASYASLECNTSKGRTQFSDFPMPADYPPYPHNREMAEYFNAYVDHFGLRDRIAFNTGVEHVAPAAGGWDVRLATGETRHYDGVAVANGHHRVPRWPSPPFPGVFSGRQLHAHDYVGPEGFEGKRVVVVGMGNSAMDIAVELSRVAEVYLSARRGAHIVPKFARGRPIDTYDMDVPMPLWLKRAIFDQIVRRSIGRGEDVGLPKPDHRLGEAHPTVSQHIIERVRAGAVKPKPNIAELRGDRVAFADGSEAAADAVIYCTGYNIEFPFFDADLVSVSDNQIDLFHRVFHPDLAGVGFIGLVQPFGPLPPLAEAQAEWFGDYLAGTYALPPRGEMLAQVETERAAIRRRFVASPRHTIEVDYYPYLRELKAERKRGEARARAKALVRASQGTAAAP